VRAPGVAVERGRAEEIRRRLAAGGWLRSELAPLREPGRVIFALKDGAPPLPPDLLGSRGEFDFVELGPHRPRDYREGLHLPSELQSLLPSSFDVIGDLVLIRLPLELRPHASEIGGALLRFVPGCRKVGMDAGVHGDTRIRTLVALAGTGDWSTRHRENGLSFEVDVERAYFSPRLAREHARVADEVQAGERVLDLFCGIGPFAITILSRVPTARAVAVDLNPDAIRLLRANAQRLHVAARLTVEELPAEEFLRRPDAFTTVVMNLPREGYKYASQVARHVMAGGALHTYEVVDRRGAEARAADLLQELQTGSGGRWEIAGAHVVHPYSPSSDLMAFAARRRS
jgi:tRNA (guanine37-N1)-methyltransferase